MLSGSALDKVKALAAEVSEREGCMLYDLEFVGQGKGRILRVYIDGKDGGVTIDQCAEVSRGLSLLLDVEDLIPGEAYDLEVSSPGVERPLREKWHFEKSMDKLVLIKTNAGIPGTEDRKSPLKQIKGYLKEVDDEKVTLVSEDEKSWDVPYSIIHKAKVIFEFSHKGQKKKGKR